MTLPAVYYIAELDRIVIALETSHGRWIVDWDLFDCGYWRGNFEYIGEL